MIDQRHGRRTPSRRHATRATWAAHATFMENLEPRTLLSAAAFEALPKFMGHGARSGAEAVVSHLPASPAHQSPAGEMAIGGAGSALVGDANGDGKVDAADFDIWYRDIGLPGAGDLNADGVADALDFDLWFNNVGQTQPTVSYDWHTQVINGVLNVWAPNPSDFGSTFKVTNAADVFGADGVPAIEAVHQGPIADCYFLSSIGELAKSHPSMIQQSLTVDANGGFAVKYYWFDMAVGGSVPVVFHTSNELSSSLQTMANGEAWPLIMEKAYAAMRTWNGTSSQNTMSSLGWGFAGTVFQQLNEGYSNVGYYAGEAAAYTTLSTLLAASKPVVIHTTSSATTMVASHVYAITGVSTSGGTRYVTMYNPWGFYDTRPLSEVMSNGVGYFVAGSL